MRDPLVSLLFLLPLFLSPSLSLSLPLICYGTACGLCMLTQPTSQRGASAKATLKIIKGKLFCTSLNSLGINISDIVVEGHELN